MRPLRVGLVHRDHPRYLDNRMIGMWSYPVPEFQVTPLPQPKYFSLNRDDLVGRFDVVFWEDGRTLGAFTGTAEIPVVYYVGDSTLTEEHFAHRYQQAQHADLILVDWDRLERFADLGKPVKRLSYCTNPRLFSPTPKHVDVGLYCMPTDDRLMLTNWLDGFCALRGYSLATGKRYSLDYCAALARTRVNINLNRNPQTRAHRCYDVMASRSCLLTSPMPVVSGEDWRAGFHFAEWNNTDDLAAQLDALLLDGGWQAMAQRGFEYVTHGHTWAHRARQLASLLRATFPQIGEAHVSVH